MNAMLARLTDNDDKRAYEFTKELLDVSEEKQEYYAFLEDFVSLLGSKKTYIRTRAFLLCCAQAKWDTEGRLEKALPDLLALFRDPKPTVVRQCLKAAEKLAVYRPELRAPLREELAAMDLNGYRDSMVPLILKDMEELSRVLEKCDSTELVN